MSIIILRGNLRSKNKIVNYPSAPPNLLLELRSVLRGVLSRPRVFFEEILHYWREVDQSLRRPAENQQEIFDLECINREKIISYKLQPKYSSTSKKTGVMATYL